MRFEFEIDDDIAKNIRSVTININERSGKKKKDQKLEIGEEQKKATIIKSAISTDMTQEF